MSRKRWPITTKALETQKSDAALYLARSSAYASLGQHERALADREEAVRLAPGRAEAWLARGGSYHELGMHEKGLADRTEAIRLDPKMAEAWCARGSAYYLLGQYRKALPDLARALELQPDYAEAKQVFEKAKEKFIEEAIRQERGGEPEVVAASPETLRVVNPPTPAKPAPVQQAVVVTPATPVVTAPPVPAASKPPAPGQTSGSAGHPTRDFAGSLRLSRKFTTSVAGR